jgi:hypothetical protein
MTENTSDTRVGTGNVFFVDVIAISSFYAIDNTPLTGFLSPITGLLDGDLVSPSTIDIFSTTDLQNTSVQVNFQTTTRLEVFLDQQLTLTQQSFLNWQAYSSNDGNNWILLGGAVSYLLDNGQTVVTIDLPAPETARYIKVVSDATIAAVTPVFITEIQASEERIAAADVVTVSRDITNLQTQFGVSARMSDNWTVAYSLRRAETLQDAGDTLQFNHSLTSSYIFSDEIGISLGISDNSDETENSPDRHTRSYSASVSWIPLSTVNFSLGYTRSESDSDDGQDSVTDSISSTLSAIIYPDLTASLTTNWSQSEDRADGSETDSYGFTFNATAYLSPEVDLITDLSYTDTSSDDGENNQSTSYGFTLGYRPSDMLLMNISFDGNVEDGNSILSGSTNWLWSKKLQSQFGFSYDFGDRETQQYNALLSWLISRSLSLRTSGNYLSAEEGDSWSYNATMNLIF